MPACFTTVSFTIWDIVTLSYVLLCMLVFVEALVLQFLVREAARLKRAYGFSSTRIESQHMQTLANRALAPTFRASLLYTDELLSTSDLKGHSSILVFFRPDAIPSEYQSFNVALRSWTQELDGHVYLICAGSRDECYRFASGPYGHELRDFAIPLLVDDDARIASSFGIEVTPQAVSLDSATRIVRYGRPFEDDSDRHSASETTISSISAPSLDETHQRSDASVTHTDAPAPSHGLIRNSDGRLECVWPDDRPDTGAAYSRVDTSVSCILTRFRLRASWSLIPFYLAFRRVRHDAQGIRGLLRASFLIEDFHTCYTLSLWSDECAILEFSTNVHAHVTEANRAFGHTYRSDRMHAEIWSAQFRLWATSEHNLQWEGLDLDDLLSERPSSISAARIPASMKGDSQ